MAQRLPAASVLLVLLVGCGSFEDDMKMICNAPNEVKLDETDDPSARATKLAQHISDRIRTDEAKQFFDDLSKIAPAERMAKVKAMAKKAGIDDCPFADIYGPPKAPN